MKRLIITLGLTISLALGSFGVGWSGDFQKGIEAYNKGDYATALKEWKPLAEGGYIDAQYNLGIMYDNGKGVLQDYVYAHMWANISASNGEKNGAEVRDIIAKDMTPSQIEKAQDLARESVAKNYKGC